MVVADLQCVTWMLRISLDKAIHLLVLKLLATLPTLADVDSALVPACFDIFTSCVAVVYGKMVVTQESEGLAATSVPCCLRTLSNLTIMGPGSSVFRTSGTLGPSHSRPTLRTPRLTPISA